MGTDTRMMDIGNKDITKRQARATAFVRLDKDIIAKIKSENMPKGNVLEAARIAGIAGAKKTADLIPLCHTIGLEYVGVDFELGEEGIRIDSRVNAEGKTGVEMEALTACAIAALTIYDMCKMFSHDIEIEKICLLEKSGGKSGEYKRKKNP
ncbi:MAG: cyclic pyranopterin monophosphate synthase MoaC [Candidatus Latescibacter sp.]|nr:cyclic pyranopterin monophosphate synthase MoaC [Candidatus Latescibacter sp.]